jgi:hypothetical protein
MFKLSKILNICSLSCILLFGISSINLAVYTQELNSNSLNTNNIKITEIAFQGTIKKDKCRLLDSAKYTCSHDKWLEITNLSEKNEDLSKYFLAINKQSNANWLTIHPLSGDIAGRTSQIIGNKFGQIQSVLKADILLSNLHFISNNSEESPYINVALLDKEKNVIQHVNINSSDFIANIAPKLSSANKSTIDIDPANNNITVNKNPSYYKDESGANYGSPKVFNFLQPQVIKTPVSGLESNSIKTVSPTISTVNNPTNPTNTTNPTTLAGTEAATPVLKSTVAVEKQAVEKEVLQSVQKPLVSTVDSTVKNVTTQQAHQANFQKLNQISTGTNATTSNKSGVQITTANTPQISQAVQSAESIKTVKAVQISSINNTINSNNSSALSSIQTASSTSSVHYVNWFYLVSVTITLTTIVYLLQDQIQKFNQANLFSSFKSLTKFYVKSLLRK